MNKTDATPAGEQLIKELIVQNKMVKAFTPARPP